LIEFVSLNVNNVTEEEEICMPYRDEDNAVGLSCISFLVGGVIGASIALLYAPQSGDLTRREMREKAERTIIKAHRIEEDFKFSLSTLIGDIKLKVNQLIEEGKDLAEDKKREILAALEAGSEALNKERSKLERR
jgi:gas vesicle protein